MLANSRTIPFPATAIFFRDSSLTSLTSYDPETCPTKLKLHMILVTIDSMSKENGMRTVDRSTVAGT